MLNSSIRDRCFVNQNRDADTFVGLKCENGEFSVHFPLGFGISENDKELRKDIILLLDTIASTTGKKDSSIYIWQKIIIIQRFQFRHIFLLLKTTMSVDIIRREKSSMLFPNVER